ncbi:MAG: hypothetical protein ACKOEH_05635, partial [Actinomycetota bacterium]
NIADSERVSRNQVRDQCQYNARHGAHRGDDTVNSLFVAAVCAVAGVLLALITNLISRNSLGVGDVRLMFVLGWFSGYLGYDSAVLTLFFSSVFAAMFGLILVVFRHATWRHQIAFGPFLTLGALFVIFAGENLPRLFVA